MGIEPRPETRLLAPAQHGSLDRTELGSHGFGPEAVLDFSANINPYGPSPLVRDALASASPASYPDREAVELREALGDDLGVAPGGILAGNGASELIWLVALAFVRPGDRVLIAGPTYSEYARVATLMGAEAVQTTAVEQGGFAPDAAAIERDLARVEPRTVFVCNPNNPTGTVLRPETILGWARAHPRKLFVVDEAYLAFVDAARSVVPARAANVLVLRSMTKDFGLAGLRLGYAVGPEETVGWLRRVQPPWSVSAVAQAAGVAALRDRAHVRRSVDLLARASRELRHRLTELGLAPLPSATHYFLLRVEDGRAFRDGLMRSGIVVRDCASFGLPAHVRIAARRPEENERLVRAVGEMLRIA